MFLVALDNSVALILAAVLGLFRDNEILGDSDAFDDLDNLEISDFSKVLGETEFLEDFVTLVKPNALGDCEALDDLARPLDDSALGDCETLNDLAESLGEEVILGDFEAVGESAESL